MMHPRLPAARGSTLIVTLVTLTALSLMAAYTLVRVSPRVRMAYQNAAWQEARVAAEAGIDLAMNDLLINASGFNGGTWSGWQEEPAPGTKGGANSGSSSLLKTTTTPVVSLVNGLVRTSNKGKGSVKTPKAKKTPAPVVSTLPLFLDNLKVSATGGVPSEVDIRLWGLQPAAAPHTQWFRIRSMATCALPPRAFDVPANFDTLLRRFNLRTVRPSQKKNDAGKPSSIGLPNISRTVEALVEPILPFELAVWAGQSIDLASTGAWNIDSFDSSDVDMSNAGAYPGRGSSLVQSNGSVACSQARPYESRYGPLIAANGTQIRGAVATNGGDDPATKAHENVTGALGLDAARVRDDFSREMPLMERPSGLVALPPPLPGASFVPGTETAPAIYAIPGSVTQMRIASLGTDVPGAIVIMIEGDLDLAGPLILPPTITALVYVRGNIAFRDNVNAGPFNSNRAPQLLIFGDPRRPARQIVQALGPISVCAAFYGPSADLSLDGSVTWIGSVAAATFRVKTGGDGGLHYDQALATVGPPISFRISRYIEDVRE